MASYAQARFYCLSGGALNVALLREFFCGFEDLTRRGTPRVQIYHGYVASCSVGIPPGFNVLPYRRESWIALGLLLVTGEFRRRRLSIGDHSGFSLL